MLFETRNTGFQNDIGGYSGAFSWWRNTYMPGLWSVCDHTGFGTIGISYAVTDDFGNLVRVKD